jgi:hypothetical protein
METAIQPIGYFARFPLIGYPLKTARSHLERFRFDFRTRKLERFRFDFRTIKLEN